MGKPIGNGKTYRKTMGKWWFNGIPWDESINWLVLLGKIEGTSHISWEHLGFPVKIFPSSTHWYKGCDTCHTSMIFYAMCRTSVKRLRLPTCHTIMQRSVLLWNVLYFYATCHTTMQRSVLLWFFPYFYATCHISMKTSILPRPWTMSPAKTRMCYKKVPIIYG